MPSKHNSPGANTSNPLFNSPHALKTHFTQCQHLKPPFQLPPCPQNTINPVPTPETPFSTAPMPSKHISPGANTSNPLFNSPHAPKTHFTRCQHLKPRLQVPPCPQNTVHPVPTPSSLPPCPVSNVLCIAAVPHSLVLLLCICVLGCSPFVLQVVPPSAMHRVRIWDAKPIEKNKQQRLQYNSHGLQFLGQQCTNCNIPQLGRLPKLGAAGGQAPHSHATWQLGSPPPCVHGT